MSSGSIANGRAIMGLLQTLMGDYSTGQLLVKSTGATGTVPAHSYAIPILAGAMTPEAIVRVEENPATTDRSWPVTSAGVLVTVTSLQGGAHVNLAAGTECRWDDPITGIEATSEVSAAGLTGGAAYADAWTLRCLRDYRSIGDRTAAQDLASARVGDFPAAVLAWVASYPQDGSVSATVGSNSARAGTSKRIFKHEWELSIISSRLESPEERGGEIDLVRSEVLATITDATAYRRMTISSPQGIDVMEARSTSGTPTSFIDVIRFTTSWTLKRRDTAVFHDWLKSRIRIQTAVGTTPVQPPLPAPPIPTPPAIDVPDITVPMPPPP